MIQAIIRTIFFYIYVTICYKIMGKREIGELGILDLTISILIGQLVAVSIENYKDSVLLTILPILVLVLIEVISSKLSINNRKFNKIVDGKPTIIIDQGKLIYKNMTKERYTIDDLLMNLRSEGISSIDKVKYAFLETNGKLSIIKNSINPLPIIVEGIIQEDTLKLINKDKKWLLKVISNNNLELEEIFYCLYKKTHLYIIKYK